MSMYCGNCGMENENGAKFCKGCGKPLTGSFASQLNGKGAAAEAVSAQDSAAQNASVKDVSAQNESAQDVSAKNTAAQNAAVENVLAMAKKLPKQAVIGAAAAGVILIAGAGMAMSSSKTINLNRYLTVDIDGYDGYGTASATIDWNAIEKKYGSRISFTKAARMEYGQALSVIDPMEVLEDSVYVMVDSSRNLSNDDTVSYTWKISDDVAKYLDCKVKSKNGTKKVSKLETVDTFDAFADLEVSFSGRDQDGWAELEYMGSDLDTYDFSCNKTSGLSNGDTVTVSIRESNIPDYANALGKVPAELKKEYTVEGLESYVKKLEEINADSLAVMQQQAEDVYRAKAAKDWGEGESLEALSYLGNYLLTSKNSQKNYLFLVYKAQVRDTYSNENGDTYNELNDVYWYIRYDDLLTNGAGTVNADLTDYSTPNSSFTVDSGVSSGWWSTKTWCYYGYTSLDELYKAVVTSNLDGYNHQDNVAGEA